MYNPYEHMKARYKKELNDSTHFFNLLNTLHAMFEWKGLPDTIRPEFLEDMLISQGVAPIAPIGGNLYTGLGGYCGDVVNFLPVDFQFTNVGVGEFRGTVGKDIVVGWNNATMTPDWDLMQFSNIFTEIDVSERLNVLFARLLRIPKVGDSKEKKAVEDSIAAILEGRISSVVSNNIKKILEDKGDTTEFLDLCDVKDIDKLQYLNQYRDNVLKRFFQKYGQGMQNTAKLAQQSVDELHGSDTVSMIHPSQRLFYRKKLAEDCNKMFGTNISVEFSECWKEQEEEMKETYSNGMLEPKEDGDTDETEQDKTE